MIWVAILAAITLSVMAILDNEKAKELEQEKELEKNANTRK